MMNTTEDKKLKQIKYLVSTLPRTKLFKSFIFDDDNVWVSFYSQKLKQFMSIALCEYQQEDESEETLWEFMNTSTKIHSSSIARNLLNHSMNEKNSKIEILFPIDKLELFIELVNKLLHKSPELVKKRKSER
eukprot:TRINITY_DN4997_c0_g1_i1.p1 TRINITY_DN4997_c0_g1~~TRINITY_DN4997_c0_g1_i1.p1  ORF type:complete len:132 (-),score=26.45 TRINITY_DN4997_c0_g1_i1:151-546(-)